MEMSQTSSQDSKGMGPKPRGSKVILQRSRRYLYVEIPPPGWTRGMKTFLIFVMGPWIELPTLTILFFILLFASNPSSANAVTLLIVLGICSLICLVGLGFLAYLRSVAKSRYILHIGRQTYGVWKERSTYVADMDVTYEDEPDPSRALGETRYLDLAALIPAKEVSTSEGTTIVGPYIEVREGIKTQKFGQGLQLIELEWILKEVNQRIRELNGSEKTASVV